MTIDEYLSSSTDYELGLSLLEEVAPNNRMLPRLRKGPSSYTRQKLRLLLRNYRNMPVSIPEPPVLKREIAETVSTAKDETTLMSPHLPMLYPPEVSAWIQDRAKLVRQRDKLSNSLLAMSTNGDRAAGREQIDSLQKQIAGLTERIEEWKQTGQVREEKPELPKEERDELRRQLNNAKANLTKKKKALNKWIDDQEADDKHRRLQIAKYQEQVKKFAALVDELREKLS